MGFQGVGGKAKGVLLTSFSCNQICHLFKASPGSTLLLLLSSALSSFKTVMAAITESQLQVKFCLTGEFVSLLNAEWTGQHVLLNFR